MAREGDAKISPLNMVLVGFLSLSLVAGSFAAHTSELVSRQSITTLSANQVESYKPYSYFASASYCGAASTLVWNCGTACSANPDFEPVASGGDGSSVQYWFVGYSPSLKSVIVSHQGTNPTQIEALATDADFFLGPLNSTLFPGVSASVQVHSGFRDEQAKTATVVLTAVKSAMSKYGVTQVTIVGHSLGAAIALIDVVYLPLHLPSGVTIRMIGYGMPRVGNQDFANYIDATASVTHVNNKEDLIPIVPGRSLGYHHPSGEVHIQDSNAWDACPGQDNTSPLCSTGDVPNIFEGDILDHLGPYDGVDMGICL